MLTVCLHVLPVGGAEDLRRYWADYLRKTHVLVYVVDSSDRSRLPLAKAELHRLLRVEPQLPVVVLGNKQVTCDERSTPVFVIAATSTKFCNLSPASC